MMFQFNLNAQKQNNIWVFGDHSGLNFNIVPPTGLDTAAIERNLIPFTQEPGYNTYGSSICDTNGNLLFYTDGITVWDKKHKVIQRYLGRWPWVGYNTPLIIPYPGNDSLYYIFGVSAGSYANRLQYLTINIKGNGGAGEIVYPQPSTLSNYFKVLQTNASVLVAGTAHCNRKDTWIVSHSNDAFYSFLLTENGVDSMPVKFPIPANVVSPGVYASGNLKFSASGEKMIMPLLSSNEIAVFDFNNLTGAFSNGIKIKMPANLILEDAEISPDGTKLYFGAYELKIGDETQTGIHKIYQMNLDAGSSDAVEKSIFSLTTVGDRTSCSPNVCFFITRTLQMAPDGKIYVSMREASASFPLNLDITASLIEEPNEQGANARYIKNAVKIKRKYVYMFYNYVRSSSYTIKENGIQFQKHVCADQPVDFSLLLTKVDSVKWAFGDAGSGNNNYSQSFTPQHIYPAPGNYLVKAIIYNTCFIDTSYANVIIEPDKTVKIPANIKDSLVCVGQQLFIDATTPYATEYVWGGGNLKPVQEITVTGRYEIKALNQCSIDVRVFNVTFQPCDCKVFVPTAFTPNNDGRNDKFKPAVKCYTKDYMFTVFNRWGQRVFNSSSYDSGWDGTIKNNPADIGTYIWMVQYRDPVTKQVFKQHGTVVLIR